MRAISAALFVLAATGIMPTKVETDPGYQDGIVGLLEQHKRSYAASLVEVLGTNGAGTDRVPDFISDLIKELIEMAA